MKFHNKHYWKYNRSRHYGIEVDTAGNIFGDYDNYIPWEFGMDYLDSNVSDDESEGAIDEEEFILTNDSEILEPERLPPTNSFLSPLPDDLTPDEAALKASQLRGGAEAPVAHSFVNNHSA